MNSIKDASQRAVPIATVRALTATPPSPGLAHVEPFSPSVAPQRSFFGSDPAPARRGRKNCGSLTPSPRGPHPAPCVCTRPIAPSIRPAPFRGSPARCNP